MSSVEITRRKKSIYHSTPSSTLDLWVLGEEPLEQLGRQAIVQSLAGLNSSCVCRCMWKLLLARQTPSLLGLVEKLRVGAIDEATRRNCKTLRVVFSRGTTLQATGKFNNYWYWIYEEFGDTSSQVKNLSTYTQNFFDVKWETHSWNFHSQEHHEPLGAQCLSVGASSQLPPWRQWMQRVGLCSDGAPSGQGWLWRASAQFCEQAICPPISCQISRVQQTFGQLRTIQKLSWSNLLNNPALCHFGGCLHHQNPPRAVATRAELILGRNNWIENDIR